MKKTIGFNNSKNIWTSKYDYESSNYASIDKRFFSCRKKMLPADDVIAWEHNVNPSRNSFYGTQYPSVIHVSFNDNPSQNKLYKTFSIEGSENLKGSLNTFITSEFLQPDVQKVPITVGTVLNKGGILYGHMGRDSRIKPNVNLKFIGSFVCGTAFDFAVEPVGNNLFVINGTYGNSVVSTTSPTYVAFVFDNNPNDIVVIDENAGIGYIGPNSDYYTLNSGIKIANNSDTEVAFETSTIRNGLVVKAGGSQVSRLIQLSEDNLGGTCSVFAISDPKINGDFLRGQYAEAAINLGKENFELYSLNVNYEPTDLDHSK